MSTNYQGFGWAGDSQRRYKPKRNVNRIINRIVTREVKAFLPGAIITQQKLMPDVSFYQGLISWDQMRSKTDVIAIRAGQGNWEDEMFRVNYAAAKLRGMLRSIYYFYDDRKSPGEQAAKLIELIGDDVPEMEIWVDWENTYNGAFKGLKNVVAFMQVVEKAFPACEVGMYTGFFWFIDHSNAILNYFQYQYLKDKPLWLAWYGDASDVRIPAPWTGLTFWQWGTPAWDWGQSSAEIDMSYYNGTEQDFYSHYAGDTPPPVEPETEEIMATLYGTAIVGTPTQPLNIRSGPGQSYSDLGNLYIGDKLEASESIGGWWKLVKIIRVNGTVETPALTSYAYSNNGLYIRTDAAPAPEPAFPPEIGLTINGVTKLYIVKP